MRKPKNVSVDNFGSEGAREMTLEKMKAGNKLHIMRVSNQKIAD
jgi:hypothetical protein